MTSPHLSLWPACVKSHPFEQQVAAASAAGYATLAISPPVYRDLQAAGMRAREVRALVADHGIRLGHYDGFSDWAPLRFSSALPAAARAIFDFSCDDCLQICEELELGAICAVGAFGAGEVELPALVEGFARFCERAARHGVQVDLEFLPMWGIHSLAVAWEIVRAAGHPNGAILLDTWHFQRGMPDMELLRALPGGAIRTLQLADAGPLAPGMDLMEDTLRFRRLPGDGDFPLREILAVLAAKGGVTSIGPEIYADAMDALDAQTAARRAAESTRALLADPRSGAW